MGISGTEAPYTAFAWLAEQYDVGGRLIDFCVLAFVIGCFGFREQSLLSIQTRQLKIARSKIINPKLKDIAAF